LEHAAREAEEASMIAPDTLTRYPLTWPPHWPRTAASDRHMARFRSQRGAVPMPHAIDRALTQLRRLRVDDWLISSNVPTRLDGTPLAGAAARGVADPGVAVYFRLFGRDQVLACDAWLTPADNLAAIAGHIEALRKMDRYKVGSLEQAFTGYQALPAKGQTWRSTLGFGPTDTITREEINSRFRVLAREAHPDLPGGSEARMKMLTEARASALFEVTT
jgi:hypothetical protein